MGNRIFGSKYSEDSCTFCGSPHWTADWRGEKKLTLICRKCAADVLPALFADATWHSTWQPSHGTRDLEMFASLFWKSQAINASRSRLGRNSAMPFHAVAAGSKN
jgi:hypothetical protein